MLSQLQGIRSTPFCMQATAGRIYFVTPLRDPSEGRRVVNINKWVSIRGPLTTRPFPRKLFLLAPGQAGVFVEWSDIF